MTQLSDDWSSYLAAFPQAELAHTWEWQNIIQTVYGYQPVYTALPAPNGTLPITAYVVRSLLSGQKISSMPFMFQAPLLVHKPEDYDVIIPYFITLAQQHRCYAELKLRQQLPCYLIKQHQLHEVPVSVYSVLPLAQDYPIQFARFSKNLQQNLKRSRNKVAKNPSITFSQSQSSEQIKAFHRCMMTMYRDKDHIPCQPLALFQQLFSTYSAEHVQLFTAWHQHQLIAGIVIVRYGNTAEYAWGATTAGFEHYNLSSLLLENSLQWAITQGCTHYSFGCSSTSDTGLLQFKARWGAEQFPIYNYYWGRKVTPPQLDDTESLSRKAFAKLPLWLIEKLLPVVVPQLA